MPIRNVTDIKINLFGAVVVGFATSITTVVVSGWLDRESTPPAFTPSVFDVGTQDLVSCDTGVYSPVQHRCVDQGTFDKEMANLFAALGLDTSAYRNDRQ